MRVGPDEKGVWWLASGALYNDSGRGTPTLRSMHQFGWDTEKQGFVIENQLGLGVVRHDRLHLSVDLVELFLLECCDPTFRQLFLEEFYPGEDIERIFEGATAKLSVHRSKAHHMGGTSYILPSLTLTNMSSTGADSWIRLFDAMRRNLAVRMASVTREQVRQVLRVQT